MVNKNLPIIDTMTVENCENYALCQHPKFNGLVSAVIARLNKTGEKKFNDSSLLTDKSNPSTELCFLFNLGNGFKNKFNKYLADNKNATPAQTIFALMNGLENVVDEYAKIKELAKRKYEQGKTLEQIKDILDEDFDHISEYVEGLFTSSETKIK